MNKFIVLLMFSLALNSELISCASFQMCNNDPVLDPPLITEETVVNFILKKKVKHNQELGYERFQALNTESNESVVAKLYLKNKPNLSKSSPLLQYFWTYKDEPQDPAKECQQLDYISKIAKSQNINDIFFENCLDNDDSSNAGAEIPVINGFPKANGEPLSSYCIFDNCRPKLQKIASLMIKALKVLATGPSFYFVHGDLSADNLYYFDMGPKKYLTVTDLKYNAVPVSDASLKPWAKDLSRVGQILAQLLTQDCSFVISDKARSSSIEFYKQVHSQPGYNHKDIDIGVNPMITTSITQDKEEKQKFLNDSLYDFILKCLDGDNQFTDPNMALQHNFITKAASTRIDRPSDVQ